MTRQGRTRALVVVLLMLLLASNAGAAPATAAAPLATLDIVGLDPAVGRPGGELQVSGTVRGGAERLRDVRVALRLSRTPVSSRAELAGVADGLTTSKDGDVVAAQPVATTLEPGQTALFDLGAVLDDLVQLREFGVYVVGVQVTASHRDGTGEVAITRTFLPWLPRKPGFRPAGFVWLWPLVSRPTRQGDGTYVDDVVGRELSAGGRLARLLDAGEQLATQLPMTWVLDPDLLDSSADMGEPGGYVVARRGTRRRGPSSVAAAGWLAQLRTASVDDEVVALPYADPDVAALRRGGLSSDVVRARETGAEVATAVLGREVITDVSWPADGFLDRPTLALLRRTGVQAAILADRAQPTRLELNYTPGGRSSTPTSAGALTTLVADGGLTRLLAHSGQTPLLAAQRFLATTAMITAELPGRGDGRVILVAPPRRWDPPQQFLDRLVLGSGAANWMSVRDLSGMRAGVPEEVERRAVHYPRPQRRAELPRAYLTALGTQHTKIATFSAVLTRPAALVPALDKAVLRLESTWWRDRANRVNRFSSESGRLADQLKSIHVQPGSYTFGSKSGTIPLTLTNGINQAVVVDLRLEPEQPRLRLRSPPEPIRIEAGRKLQVPVEASAVAGGTVLVNATLHTREGVALSPQPVQLQIRITQYGTVALVITVLAGGVLVLAALARLARRAAVARTAGSGGPA